MERVNAAVREVVADELELIDDPRLNLVTVMGVDVTADLRQGVVWFSSAPATPKKGKQARSDETVAAALGEHRIRLQKAIAAQLRMKRTPELRFKADPAIAAGTIVEDLIRQLHKEEG